MSAHLSAVKIRNSSLGPAPTFPPALCLPLQLAYPSSNRANSTLPQGLRICYSLCLDQHSGLHLISQIPAWTSPLHMGLPGAPHGMQPCPPTLESPSPVLLKASPLMYLGLSTVSSCLNVSFLRVGLQHHGHCYVLGAFWEQSVAPGCSAVTLTAPSMRKCASVHRVNTGQSLLHSHEVQMLRKPNPSSLHI